MSQSLKRILHRRAAKFVEKRSRLDAEFLGVNNPSVQFNHSLDGSADDVQQHSGDSDRNSLSADENNEEGVSTSNLEVPEQHESDCFAIDEDCASVSDAHDSASDVSFDAEEHPPQFNDREKEQFVIDSVREWAMEPGVLSLNKLENLLHRLAIVFPRMPLSSSTLFACDYHFDFQLLESGGQMWYKGIRNNLNCLALEEYLKKFNKISLDIGIDGLPLFKSPVTKLWPILAHLVGTDNAPFIIAVWCGSSDPTNVEHFLSQYVDEIDSLQRNGFEFKGKVYEFSIRNYILDAPARNFVRCAIGHTGRFACEKCLVEGDYIDNRVTLLDIDAPLRSDESFQQREQPRHHKGISPLERVGTGMVSQFRLDPMHMLYAGVFKRLLEFWITVNGPWKLHHSLIDVISSVLLFLRNSCPSDFNRKARSLHFWKSFKFTALRRLVLYDGLVGFKDVLEDNIYKHYLLLQCSLYILSSRALFSTKRDLAFQLIRAFITHSSAIYGAKFVVYNVHCFSHMVNECDDNGTLEEFSAWKFENRLKSIKESVRSGLHPLQQIARRDQEKTSNVVVISSKASRCTLSLKHSLPNEVVAGQQYRKLKAGSLMLKIGAKDSCFKTPKGDVVVLKNIVCSQKKVYLIGCRFHQLEDYYDYPIPSSELGIFQVSRLGDSRRVYHLSDVECKCWLMPEGDHFFVVLKFPSEDEEVFFEVGLASWLLGDLDEDMRGQTYWPPDTKPISNLIKLQTDFDPTWKTYEIIVMRFHDTYVRAREAVNRFIEDSTYETEYEVQKVGRGCRKKIKPSFLESSDSEVDEPKLKRSKHTAPAPPPIDLKKKQVRKGQSILTKAESSKNQRDELMKRLKTAREKAAAKMNPISSPSPKSGGMTSPWRVSSIPDNRDASPSLSQILTPELTRSATLPNLSPSMDTPLKRTDNPQDMIGGTEDSFERIVSPNWKSPGRGKSSVTKRGAQSSVFSRNSGAGRRSLFHNDASSIELTGNSTASTSGFMPADAVTATVGSSSAVTALSKRGEFQGTEDSSERIGSPNWKSPGRGKSSSPVTERGAQSSVFSRNSGAGRRSLFHNDASSIELTGNSTASTSGFMPADAVTATVGSSSAVTALSKRGQFQASSSNGRQNPAAHENKTVEERLDLLEKQMKRIEAGVIESSGKNDIILMNVGRVLRAVNPNERRISAPHSMPPLPLKTRQDLNKFEAFLALSDANLAATCDYMASFVKTSNADPERKSAKAVLSKLLTNSLAKEMNLEGGNGKIAFRVLHLYKVFQGTLQAAFADSDLTIAEDALQKWLKDAKWRKQTVEV